MRSDLSCGETPMVPNLDLDLVVAPMNSTRFHMFQTFQLWVMFCLAPNSALEMSSVEVGEPHSEDLSCSNGLGFPFGYQVLVQ